MKYSCVLLSFDHSVLECFRPIYPFPRVSEPVDKEQNRHLLPSSIKNIEEVRMAENSTSENYTASWIE